ncbi:tetratricopeptide (TPR) repeat protein/GGDEF domain-containing protein [Desulfobaculum xiamenense]|uniref:Tetratricopeptide (TPR) repeat protein/GGDEF domain-containing protein n=1 Tax=Desulfobaculum xiamenense TaxID=995050 RepID=A0A846QL74_9BACT|nr:tetratricopeptide repeat protein [Desulfobaculum xiamenense]NJB68928.1 tetratricopeptide (TPR) repeat protein/GGDEF domain-containing protein [Desulfobaculum xiamenense]
MARAHTGQRNQPHPLELPPEARYAPDMSAHTSLLPDNGPALDRRDLISFEHLLQKEIAAFLPFTSYSLFFPRSLDGGGAWEGLRSGMAVHLPEEEKVFLPLVLDERMLGVFAARGVKIEDSPSLASSLAAMAGMCMQKLQLYKASITDPLTGLANAAHFLRTLGDEVSALRDCMVPGSGSCMRGDSSGPAGGFCVMHILLADMHRWQDRYGYAFGDRAIAAAASVVSKALPEDALAARLSDDSLAVLWPGAAADAGRKLANRLAARLETFTITDTVLDQELALSALVGVVHYPVDMTDRALHQPVREQAGALTAKATRAAQRALRGKALGFGQIVQEGGRVREVLPLNRLTINLGRNVGAAEGQRFLVWSDDHGGGPDTAPMCKGEVLLMEIRPDSALADIMHLSDPAWTIAAGDRLTLAPEAECARFARADDGPHRDMLTGQLLYADFQEAFASARDGLERFSLVLVRLPDQNGDDAQVRTEAHLRDVSATCASVFGPRAVGGRFSIGSVIWFLPDITGRKAASLCRAVRKRLERSIDTPPAFGVATFPYLTFSRADTLDNVRKALDYAQLLPAPSIALTDSVALNISADRMFAQGRLYDAIEEYKLSLLADRTNAVARNSLGICLARAGELSQAKRQFRTVFTNDPTDLFAHYNYGYACQKMKQYDDARDAYEQCLRLDPKHIFSHVRLGELLQREGRFDDARERYTRAAAIRGGEGLTRRYLARLALAQGRADEAREHLHQALIHDPKDAVSLHLMARLYLDNGEDPQVAESLARQSAALVPQQPAFWKELARALTAQGRTEEAHEALARAEAL